MVASDRLYSRKEQVGRSRKGAPDTIKTAMK